MIHLLAAVEGAAQPLVRHFGLRPAGGGAAHPLYRGDGVTLAVCGPGRRAAAAAVADLHDRGGGSRNRPWILVALGGHPQRAPGEAVLAHRIVDAATGRSFYPQAIFTPPLPGETVISVAEAGGAGVEGCSAGEGVYDREAAGFFAAATRRAGAELVQVLAIVAERGRRPPRRLAADEAAGRVAAHLPAVERLAEDLSELAAATVVPAADPAALAAIVARRHFTVTQRRQLERLLLRLETLEPGLSPERDLLAGARSAVEVLERLRTRVRQAAARLSLA